MFVWEISLEMNDVIMLCVCFARKEYIISSDSLVLCVCFARKDYIISSDSLRLMDWER